MDTPGALHHIIVRGIERPKIFRDNKYRENFLERLVNLLSETKTVCYVWVFESRKNCDWHQLSLTILFDW